MSRGVDLSESEEEPVAVSDEYENIRVTYRNSLHLLQGAWCN